jgi:hypothetical protein
MSRTSHVPTPGRPKAEHKLEHAERVTAHHAAGRSPWLSNVASKWTPSPMGEGRGVET